MILYHGTTSQRLYSILEKGLLPRKNNRSSNVLRNGKRISVVCLTSSQKIANYFANRKCLKENGFPIILKMQINKEKLLSAIDFKLNIYLFASPKKINSFSYLNGKILKTEQLLKFFYKE